MLHYGRNIPWNTYYADKIFNLKQGLENRGHPPVWVSLRKLPSVSYIWRKRRNRNLFQFIPPSSTKRNEMLNWKTDERMFIIYILILRIEREWWSNFLPLLTPIWIFLDFLLRRDERIIEILPFEFSFNSMMFDFFRNTVGRSSKLILTCSRSTSFDMDVKMTKAEWKKVQYEEHNNPQLFRSIYWNDFWRIFSLF